MPQSPLRLGGVVAAALLAIARRPPRRPSLSRSTPSGEAARRGAGRHGAFRAALAAGRFQGEGFEGYSPWDDGPGNQNLGTPPSAASPRSAGPATATRWSATARSCRCATTIACAGAATTPTALPGSPGNWLDSNDNRGIKLRISGLGAFNALGFFVVDAADVGGRFSIKVGDTLYRDIADGARLRNGNIHFVRILLDEAVDKLTSS